jgi:ketosteroid isomerase-like protein
MKFATLLPEQLMERHRRSRVLLPAACAVIGVIVIADVVGGQATTVRQGSATSDSSEVVAVVRRYHAALAAGDSAAALSLLAPDAVILESGGVETREDYRAHHLPADIGFARAVPSERSDLRAVVRGDAAWVSSTSTSRGEFRGRQINSRGAELVVLSRELDGWRIRAIHWSARNRSP